MKYSTTVTQKGQITLSVKLRRSLGIHPGERLRVELKGTSAVITKDTYWEDVAAVRQRMATRLAKKGLSGLSLEEVTKRANQAKKQLHS